MSFPKFVNATPSATLFSTPSALASAASRPIPPTLPFLLEDRLQALPSFAVTLGSPGAWIRAPQFGVNYAKLVHYEQAATFSSALHPAGDIVSRARVASVTDRGEGRGAVVVVERDICDATNEVRYCNVTQTLLLRGDGGFGGAPPPREAAVIPEREPDKQVFSKSIRGLR